MNTHPIPRTVAINRSCSCRSSAHLPVATKLTDTRLRHHTISSVNTSALFSKGWECSSTSQNYGQTWKFTKKRYYCSLKQKDYTIYVTSEGSKAILQLGGTLAQCGGHSQCLPSSGMGTCQPHSPQHLATCSVRSPQALANTHRGRPRKDVCPALSRSKGISYTDDCGADTD